MDMTKLTSAITVAFLITLAIVVRPIRKTIGLLLVIIGGIICFTFIGMVIGIPMIIVGGLLLFI
jgi:hypothetical protein